MGHNKARGLPPRLSADTIADRNTTRDYDKDTPRFCLRHLQPSFDIHELDKSRRAAFALALQKRATLTWSEIIRSHRHKLGPEKIPSTAIKAPIPVAFQDAPHFMVLRYDGLLPMAGVRINDTFHILWIEPEFGKLYDHG